MAFKNILVLFVKKHKRLRGVIASCHDRMMLLPLFLNLLFQNFILRFFLRKPKYTKKYRISICGIFKNEAPFLKEWIEFHEMIGVEHFYLYNNNSEDNYKEVLQPYMDKGLVSLIDWPYDQAQIKAYQNFYETYRHETQWVSFLDIDEFFCPRYERTLTNWLAKYDKYPVLVIYWRMFGTSGQLYHQSDQLVIEQYSVSWDHLYHCGKCLVNTDYDISVFDTSTHHLTRVRYPLLGGLFRWTMFPVNQFGWFVFDPIFFSHFDHDSNYTIQINHYWSKAWDVYEKKRRMTDVYFKVNPKLNMDYFFEHEENNRTTNHVIFRFLMQLKLKMGLYKYENN